MIKSLDNDSNIYLSLERFENVSFLFSQLNTTGTYLLSNLDHPSDVFNELHAFSKTHRSAERTTRRNIEAIKLELMIPPNMKRDQILELVRLFAVRAFQDLPYVAFQVTHGDGHYIDFLISERRYRSKSEKVDVVARSDVYQKVNEKGKKVFAKATDSDAICIKKKGTVYSSYSTHFTNKSRLFTGNTNEFLHKIRMLKQIAVTILNELNFVTKRVFFKKINCKKAQGNLYRYLNIRDLNDTFLYFEKILNLIEEQLLLGYMEEELNDLYKIKFKFLSRARNLRFKYGRVSLPFHYCMKRDLFRDNLQSLTETFDAEINKLKQEMSLDITGVNL